MAANRFFLACLLCCSLSLGATWQHKPGDDQQISDFRPEISVYLPLGGGLAYQSARLFVDEVEVTPIKTSLLVTYRPERPLTRGKHRVRLELGEHRQEWQFEVLGTSLISGCVFQAPPLVQPFDKIAVELSGVPRARAWAEMVGLPDRFEMKEKRRGQYQGLIKVPARAGVENAQIEVFLEKDGQLDRQICPGRLSMAAPKLEVSWQGPPNGSLVEKDFRATGTAAPGSIVTIKARLFFRDGVEFGRLPPESSRQVVADAQGRFAYAFTFPPGLPRLGVRLRAQARDEQGHSSPAVDLLLFQGRSAKMPQLRTEVPPVKGAVPDGSATPPAPVPPLP